MRNSKRNFPNLPFCEPGIPFFSSPAGVLQQWIEVQIESNLWNLLLIKRLFPPAEKEVTTLLTVQPGIASYTCYAQVWLRRKNRPEHAVLRLEMTWYCPKETTCPVRPSASLGQTCSFGQMSAPTLPGCMAVMKPLLRMTLISPRRNWPCARQPAGDQNPITITITVHALELEYFEEFYPDRVAQLADAIRRAEITLNPFYTTFTINISWRSRFDCSIKPAIGCSDTTSACIMPITRKRPVSPGIWQAFWQAAG